MKTLQVAVRFVCVALAACVARHDDVDTQRAELTPEPAAREPAAQPRPLEPTVGAPRAAGPGIHQSAGIAVRWSSSLGLAGLDQLDARLAAVDPIGFGELELGDEQVLPTSCAEWARLHAAGYVPSTTLEVQPDGAALPRCETLRLLRGSRPARVSFVRELPAPGPKLASILPVAIATAESREREARVNALVAKGASIVALDSRVKLEKLEAPALVRVRESDGQSYADLEPMALADFDGDGVEDVAMAVRNVMTQGSYSTSRLLLLTRNDERSVLGIIDVKAALPR